MPKHHAAAAAPGYYGGMPFMPGMPRAGLLGRALGAVQGLVGGSGGGAPALRSKPRFIGGGYAMLL